MKLLVTDNLISDLNKLDKFNISLEKVSIKEIPNQAQSLFENDKFASINSSKYEFHRLPPKKISESRNSK